MKKIDCGHYIDRPVVSGEGTLIIPKGMSLHDCYFLSDKDKLPFNQIILEESALADIVFFVESSASVDCPILVNLVGENANVNISAAYLCSADERINFTTEIIHRVPNCISSQLFNGIVSSTARVKFDGKIVVAPDAQKTQAYQINRNILLTDTARVDTLPQLEIYADDVKCSHGATIGALNEAEQFYMRSRGITEQEAKKIQVLSFLSPVLDHVVDNIDRERAEQLIHKAVEILF